MTPSNLPVKINLGCGWDKRPGYLNVDFHAFHEPDCVADITNLDTLPARHFTEIVAQDVLEHLRRDSAGVALREWARIAAPGARLVLRLPNLLGLAFLFTTMTDLDAQRTLVGCMFGTQAYDGDYHQNGYTELLLRDELAAAGWAVESLEPFDEWLFDVVAIRSDSPPAATLDDCRFMRFGKPSELSRAPIERH